MFWERGADAMNFGGGAKHTDRDGGGVSVGAVILRDASGPGAARSSAGFFNLIFTSSSSSLENTTRGHDASSNIGSL